jgi:hypothetical protein
MKEIVMDQAASRFVGWHQPHVGRPWKKVVETETEEECRRLLETRCEGGVVKVMPVGAHPANANPQKRAER